MFYFDLKKISTLGIIQIFCLTLTAFALDVFGPEACSFSPYLVKKMPF